MGDGRRRKGFETAGAGEPLRGAVNRSTARKLAVGRAWRSVAGEELFRRAPKATLARGTLTVELLDEDASWRKTLTALLPALAGRMTLPPHELDVRRCRLAEPAGSDPAAAVAVVPPSSDDVVAELARGMDRTRREREPASDATPDPLRVMERYLARSSSDQKR